ncbi:hypothetical protein EJ06DRAFT_244724 [Trichodelitschia bisporula]|uniref:Uncharacterized protein n=1 Tax=Trichodelitschia bisporula TaxID=703511 RepID=A0A6G1HJR2_9PEZI|nr:hypothetical protein EJ06DRAFT_244724 [Trichodelitschia bisporula]
MKRSRRLTGLEQPNHSAPCHLTHHTWYRQHPPEMFCPLPRGVPFNNPRLAFRALSPRRALASSRVSVRLAPPGRSASDSRSPHPSAPQPRNSRPRLTNRPPRTPRFLLQSPSPSKSGVCVDSIAHIYGLVEWAPWMVLWAERMWSVVPFTIARHRIG